MAFTKITRNFQITIPKKIRQKIPLNEGELLYITTEGEKIVISKIIDPSQAWFWTPEWQEMEKQAQKDILTGDVKTFNSVDELSKEIGKGRKKKRAKSKRKR